MRAANDPWGSPRVNGEGLTWGEWWRAARITPHVPNQPWQRYLDAWRQGEDPTDYAIELARAEVP